MVTDSLSVLNEFGGCPGIELVLLGGTLEQDGNTFDGLLAVESARRIQVDCCFFSSTGFSDEGIVNAGMIGSQVKQLMIKSARKVGLLADSTKYGRNGIFKLCRWSDVDVLFTDSDLPVQARSAIRGAGTEVRVAALRRVQHEGPCLVRPGTLRGGNGLAGSEPRRDGPLSRCGLRGSAARICPDFRSPGPIITPWSWGMSLPEPS